MLVDGAYIVFIFTLTLFQIVLSHLPICISYFGNMFSFVFGVPVIPVVATKVDYELRALNFIKNVGHKVVVALIIHDVIRIVFFNRMLRKLGSQL